MLKFHHRLLILISTITIISFIGLGAIVHNMIYQTLTQNQTKELEKKHVTMLVYIMIIKKVKLKILQIIKKISSLSKNDKVIFTTNKKKNR